MEEEEYEPNILGYFDFIDYLFEVVAVSGSLDYVLVKLNRYTLLIHSALVSSLPLIVAVQQYNNQANLSLHTNF